MFKEAADNMQRKSETGWVWGTQYKIPDKLKPLNVEVSILGLGGAGQLINH